ncbi:MAG: DNA cytosine methyltransferase [Chthoniobacteraceae bacterium]
MRAAFSRDEKESRKNLTPIYRKALQRKKATLARKGGMKRTKAPRRRQPIRKARRTTTKAKANHHNTNGSAVVREDPVEYATTLCRIEPVAFSTVDLFCGAGGITEGFRRAGFGCLYANDINPSAVETFRANHPQTRAENRPIEQVDAAALRRSLNLRAGDLDVLVGGPPCQGFSINAPERFLHDPRNVLFKHYVRFLEEFQPKTLLIENVPGMLSLLAA